MIRVLTFGALLCWRLGEALDGAGYAFSDAGELALRAGHRLDGLAGDLADCLDELRCAAAHPDVEREATR